MAERRGSGIQQLATSTNRWSGFEDCCPGSSHTSACSYCHGREDQMNDRLVGFAFPFRIGGGGISRASSFEKLEQNVRHLLSTRLSERVMLRTYGGGVHQRLQ